MFKEKNKWGDHVIYEYNTEDLNFKNFLKKLYNEENLEKLYLKSINYIELKDRLLLGGLNDTETDLHKIFYKKLKNDNEFKELYCKFIKKIHEYFFPNEEYLIYQSFPSIRFQFPESIAIPPHKDSDALSNHPIGEKNFIIPITQMKNTNSIIIESKCDKKDFKSINLDYGNLFFFNGNTCTHYNEKNIENKLRISLDFRIITKEHYLNYLNNSNLKKTNPRDIEKNRKPTKMLIGGYYQVYKKSMQIHKMMKWYKNENIIMQHRPTFEKEEANAVYKYMLEDTFLTEYKKTIELENIISKYVGSKYCIMTTSGTCALILGLMSLNLNIGDEVIVPNYTMIATINAVKMLKLIPIIIDVDKETYTMNVDEIQKNISDKTKCVIHVSLNNRYKDIDKILNFCRKKNLILMEDSAQSLGLKVNGKSLGTFGKIGCFSLSTPKIISTGQGGFLITDDDELNKKIRMIKNFGRVESGKDNFEVFGINLKFTDLQAVIGIEQMKKINYRTKRMNEIYNLYYENLKDKYEIKKPLDDKWFPWFVDIYVKERDYIIDILKKHNIQTRKTYDEINKSSIYFLNNKYENSNYVSTRGLFLPSYITISNDEINYICNILNYI